MPKLINLESTCLEAFGKESLLMHIPWGATKCNIQRMFAFESGSSCGEVYVDPWIFHVPTLTPIALITF
jgi:hypothetical protein